MNFRFGETQIEKNYDRCYNKKFSYFFIFRAGQKFHEGEGTKDKNKIVATFPGFRSFPSFAEIIRM